MEPYTRIYIADDEKIIRESIRDFIDWTALRSRVVGIGKNGREVLDFIAGHEVDILISDICMPEMDGLELLKQLLELDSALRVILISAYSSFEYIHQALKYEIVDDYLLKPVNPDDLTASVKKSIQLLHKREQQDFIHELSPHEQIEYASSYFAQHSTAIADCLQKQKYHPARSLFHNCMTTIQEKQLSLNFARRFSMDLFFLISDTLYSLHLCISNAIPMEDTLFQISTASNYEQLSTTMGLCFRKICDYIEAHQTATHSALIYQAVSIMKQEYSNADFSLQTLSDLLRVSNTYLSAKFKEDTGMNFSKMLTMLRITEARKMLADPESSIPEIARDCGISDVRYFSRIFHNYTGQTPKEYRAFILYGRVMNCSSVQRILNPNQLIYRSR